MIGNSVNYDKEYKENQSIWGTAKLDDSLKRYLKLLDGKNVLDLGIGEGNNSISLSNLGFNVTGIDSSKKALDICKSNSNNIKLINEVKGKILDFFIYINYHRLLKLRTAHQI